MALDLLGSTHVVAAASAIACGCAVAASPKGTVAHRRIGRAYVSLMLVANLSALCLYRFNGGPNLFHLFALISLASIAAGVHAARGRRPGWRRAHARTMLWSFVGLLAAAASEAIVRVPAMVPDRRAFIAAVAGASLATVLAGGLLIQRQLARIR